MSDLYLRQVQLRPLTEDKKTISKLEVIILICIQPIKIQGLTVVSAGGMATTAVCAFILVDTSPDSKAALPEAQF